MNNNIDNENDTAMTVVADDSIKEMLKSGDMEKIQKIVQEGQSATSANSTCFSWAKGQIIGKYEICKRIGKGGMGVIYLARHTQLDTLRALKVLPAESAEENPVFAERFIREARIASQIRHPNVVEVMDVESDPENNVSYIVMEYVDGGSLRQVLKAMSKLNIEQAIVTIQSVTAALNVAAEHGIVHRDIKPDNIMFTKAGSVKLADLGIAKKDDEDDSLTKTNVMMGTPAYLSPEQVENPKAVDIRSDIYSLGATFYEMLTGQTPYPGKTSYDILRKIFSDPVPDPRSVNPEIPGEISSIVMKMLSKEPQKRYQTPAEVLEALAKILPALSDSDMQMIVKSIIDINSGVNSEYTSSNSIFTGTICRMRKREKRKKIFIWAACSCLLLGILGAAGVLLPQLLEEKQLPDKRTHFSVKDTLEKKQFTSFPAPAAVPEIPVKETPLPKKDVHSLNIKTTPFATLRLVAADGQIFSYAGDREGNIQITGLTAGEYEVEISCQDHFPYKNKHKVPAKKILNLPLKADYKTLSIAAVAGTKLELQYPDGKERSFTVPAGGFIKIKNLKKGSYLIKGTHPEYHLSEKRLMLEKDLRILLPMEKIYKIFFITTLPGSQVELLQNSQVKFTQKTAANGKNIFNKIKQGVYELRVTAPYYNTHSSVLYIEKDTALTITLKKSRYSITVYGTAGTNGKMFSGKKKIREFQIPSAGYLVINDIEHGKYTFDFTRKGFIAQKRNIDVLENTSLQISLSALPSAKKAPEKKPVPAMGGLNVYLSCSDDLLKYIRTNGFEIKLGNEEWVHVSALPFTKKLQKGEYKVGVRGEGIETQMNQKVYIYANRNTDFLLEVKAKYSEIVLASNRADARFRIGKKSYPANEAVEIAPFREYTVVASSRKQAIVKKVTSSTPGEQLTLTFKFATIVHPMQKKYDEGMKLFKQEKYKDALAVLLTAAQGKHMEAALVVARIYERGLGMWFSDEDKAMYWYYQAAELGNVNAALRMADAIYNEEYNASTAQMLKFYLLAVKANDPEISYKVSLIYQHGFRDIKADEGQALVYLQKAAELGVPEAMYDLGIRYEKGQGVPYNSKMTLYWIKKAADKGHLKALEYWNQINK